jgi:DNA-binding SARP family transcriptional activator/LysM repeat protein
MLVLTGATEPLLATSKPAAAAIATPGVATATNSSRTYVVQRGDTLWGIAERQLGDPLRWSEIYQLNEGRPQPDGRALTDPHWIDPGWTLVMPASPDAAPTSPAPSPTAHAPAPPPTTTVLPVTTQPTTTEPTPATPPTSVTPPASTGGERRSAHGHEADRDGAPATPVRLPSGSVVGGSFALGILSALALARLRRRHAYRYRPPAPGRHLGPDPLRPTLRALATVVQPAEDENAPGRAPIEIIPASADEDPDHRERPDLIEVGDRDGEPVAVSLSDLAGVVLCGTDAEDVGRAWVAALLVRAGPLAAEVLTTEATVERLVPGAGAGATKGEVPGLRVVPDDGAVLRSLEAEVLARSRQLDVDDAPDVLTYRRTYPWDPLPTIVGLVDEVPVEDFDRWAAVCSSGGRLALGAIMLGGDSPNGVRLDLDARHIVVQASPEDVARRLVGVRCFVLGPDEAADVFATLTEVERRPASDEESDEMAETPTDAALEEEAWPTSVPPAPDAIAMSGEASGPSLVEVTSEVPPPIAVRLFGPYEIVVDGETIASGLRGVARELLAWYLLRPEGASIGAAVEACWPNTDPAEVSTKFWRAASDLRKRVGRTARPETQLLVQVGDVYRLDPHAIDCDLWQFQAALAEATHADSDGATREALRRAVALYGGDLVKNADYRWVEPVRQDLHRRALDAHLRLAELEEQLGALDAAEEALGRAIELDRYAEEPYRRLMTLQGEHGRREALAATWRLLERRLAEIDVEPEPATVRLHRSLTTDAAPAGGSRRVRLSS